MPRPPAYLLKTDLSEKQIEADVSHHLGRLSTVSVFRLMDVDEQGTGADKVMADDVGALFYMQFKKSEGLRPAREVAPSRRKNRSKQEDIREFRAAEGLEDDPSLFFGLRRKAAGATDFQHNILRRYHIPPASNAMYVAPLCLDKQQYGAALLGAPFAPVEPWLHPFYFMLDLEIRRPRLQPEHLRYVPFLREHVSIPPTSDVDTHEHWYSFSQTGTDVVWHSPDIIGREPMRLSDMLAAALESLLADNKERMLRVSALVQRCEETAAPLGYEPRRDDQRGALRRLSDHGRWLQREHAIRQFLLIGRRT
jgi:hypothetical protein